MGTRKKVAIAAGVPLLLIAATLLVYLPSLSNDFVNWDDPVDLVRNPHVHAIDGESLAWMFTGTLNGNWIPLNWLSHAVVCRFFGLDPAAHHAANLVLHAINVLLVYALFAAILKRGVSGCAAAGRTAWCTAAAALGALFWAIHPLHVESVAWVTERKDVGSTLFFLLAVLCYLKYAAADRRIVPYVLSMLFMVLSLLFKPMAVTLPLVLLLLDAWPLGRVAQNARRVVLEKIPFVLIGLGSGLVAIWAQGGAVAAVDSVPLGFRVMNAFHSIVFYLVKLAVPVELAAIYPITDPEATATSIPYLAAALGVIAITAGCVLAWRRGSRALPVAWAFFLVTLGPVIGILQVGVQAAADRYTYLPTLSISLAAAAVVILPGRPGPRPVRALLFAAALCALGALCVPQIKVWKNSLALWEHQVSVYPGESERAYSNLGRAYAELGRTDDAIRTYREAMTIDTPHARTHDALGCALLDLDAVDEAIAQFKLAASKDPAYAEPWRNLGIAFARKGLVGDAAAAIGRALQINPQFSEAWCNLGTAYLNAGKPDEAADAFVKALRIKPNDQVYTANLATARMRQNSLDEAIELFSSVVEAKPGDGQAASNLGLAYLKKGALRQAVVYLGKAAELEPSKPAYHQLFAEALERSGRKPQAIAAYQNAVRADGNFAPAHVGLTRLHLEAGNLEAARRHGRKAIELDVEMPPAIRSRLFGQ